MTARLGAIGAVSTAFFRSERFGGFRDRMPYPLLVDMAIHAFDSVRFLLRAEPVTAYCQSYNPPWSWFAGDANATVVFEMEGGTRYLYHGSWCSPGEITSWNGAWRVSGEKGTALWDGDHEPVLERTHARALREESRADVRTALAGWSPVRAALAGAEQAEMR